MIVTGVQPVGAKGLTALQVATVDVKDAARGAGAVTQTRPPTVLARAGEPPPVVLPRGAETPLDQRPVALRRQHAARRYRDDGGEHDDADDLRRRGRYS